MGKPPGSQRSSGGSKAGVAPPPDNVTDPPVPVLAVNPAAGNDSGPTFPVLGAAPARQEQSDDDGPTFPVLARNPHLSIRRPATGHYGWSPDFPDARDHIYAAPAFTRMPPTVNLRNKCPPVYDQGQARKLHGQRHRRRDPIRADGSRNSQPDFMPSRLFIYYNERVIEHRWPRTAARKSATASRASPAGRLSRNGMAVCRRQVQNQAAREMLRRRPQIQGDPVSACDTDVEPIEGLPGVGFSVCIRLHGL